MTRFFRAVALILILALFATALSSCGLIDRIKLHFTPASEPPRGIPESNDAEYINLNKGNYTYSSAYTPIHPRHSYENLDEGQQALYDALYENVHDVYPDTDGDEALYKTKQAIVDGYVLSSADIRVAAKALYDDNPDLFWLSGTIYQLVNQQEGYTAVQMRSIYSPEEIKSMQSRIREAVNAVYAEIPAGYSEYEREKFVHDRLGEVCEYDKEAAKVHDTDDKDAEAYIVYGALVTGEAVCEGYARAMQLMCCGLGVDCVGITGMGYDSQGDEDLHMWNAVCIDGSWYFVDPTWDDQLYDYRRYQYFNLDSKMMNQDHAPSKTPDQLSENEINGDETYSSIAINIFLPECSSTQYEYYRFECAHLSDYDGDDVIEALYKAALDQQSFLTFYIDPEALDYDEAISVLFKESPQYFFDYADTVNDWLSGYEIDNSNMSYYPNEERSAVTVMLSYY